MVRIAEHGEWAIEGMAMNRRMVKWGCARCHNLRSTEFLKGFKVVGDYRGRKIRGHDMM